MAYQQTDTGLKLRGDIKFFYTQFGDLAPADNKWDGDINDVVSDPGLETAILISLFSDRRASAEDVIPDLLEDNRRGWWADALLNDKVGSKLWLLSREKTGQNLNAVIEEYVNDALKWMVTDGIAKKTTCTVTRVSANAYRILTKIERSTSNDITFTFYYNWLSQTIGGTNGV
jgi:phage gp46-like protein